MKEDIRKRKTARAFTPVVLLTAFFLLTAWSPFDIFKREKAPPLEKGAAAPQFELKTLAGETVSLNQFTGKAVLIKFWSAW